jgi:hypothetical protein
MKGLKSFLEATIILDNDVKGTDNVSANKRMIRACIPEAYAGKNL